MKRDAAGQMSSVIGSDLAHVVVPEAAVFCCKDACLAAQCIAGRAAAGLHLVIDLTRVKETCTAAFAQLILLRRALREAGGDLCLRGLSGRVLALYRIARLNGVLPIQ